MNKTKHLYAYLVVDLETYKVKETNGVCAPSEICQWLARKLELRERAGIPLDANSMIVICPVKRVPNWFSRRQLADVIEEVNSTKTPEQRNGRCI